MPNKQRFFRLQFKFAVSQPFVSDHLRSRDLFSKMRNFFQNFLFKIIQKVTSQIAIVGISCTSSTYGGLLIPRLHKAPMHQIPSTLTMYRAVFVASPQVSTKRQSSLVPSKSFNRFLFLFICL